MAVHRAPLPVLAAVDVGRSELRLLRGPTVPGVRIALDGRRVREIPCYTGGYRLPVEDLDVGECGRNEPERALTGSVPDSSRPRAAKSVTGSSLDHSARLGSGSPS